MGGFTYLVLNLPPMGHSEVIDINPITEEVFEKFDNLFVFFLDSSEDLLERRDSIQRAIWKLKNEKSLQHLRFYHSIKKEGDPPLPEPSTAHEGDDKKPMRVVMYKGQRKAVLHVGAEVPVSEALDFFAPLSQECTAEFRALDVPLTSGNSFAEDVVAASASIPVLLQMYEDTCFLCFLMRPFVNSLAVLLSSNGVPMVFKRLNIEKNDFPSGCPVARGTPTFVLFRGPNVRPEKWEEFKPKDLCEKITKVFPQQTESIFEQMDEFQGLVSKRFQLFTQLVMWTTELQKLEVLVSEAPMDGATADSHQPEETKEQEDTNFNATVSEMMARDMKRTDGIVENLAHLQQEVDEVEHDAALMGAMLAQAVLRREQAEEQQARCQRQ